MKRLALIVIILAAFAQACTKPLVTANAAKEVAAFSQSYAANANDTYYAMRWALRESGIPVATEDLPKGVITTKWMPVGSDSHFLYIFERRDYGVTNSYYQLEIQLSPNGGGTLVKIASRAKSLASGLKSSGLIEEKVFAKAADFLRAGEPTITNLGVSE